MAPLFKPQGSKSVKKVAFYNLEITAFPETQQIGEKLASSWHRCSATHHFLVRGETYSNPAICVCTHLILHICPNATVTQKVVTRLCITPRLPISEDEKDEYKHSNGYFLNIRDFS